MQELLNCLNTSDQKLKKKYLQVFSGLGTVIEKIKRDYEFVENKISEEDEMIDQKDFDEYEPEKN